MCPHLEIILTVSVTALLLVFFLDCLDIVKLGIVNPRRNVLTLTIKCAGSTLKLTNF